MKLLKTTLVLTLSAVIMLSMAFAVENGEFMPDKGDGIVMTQAEWKAMQPKIDRLDVEELKRIYTIPSSRDELLTEGFEVSVPPEGWTLQNNGYDFGFIQNGTRFYEGYYSAFCDDVAGQQQATELISPSLNLTGFSSAALSFYQYQNYGSYYNYHEVSVYVGGVYTAAVDLGVGIEDTWSQVLIDLSPYVDNTDVQIGIYYTGFYADEWWIDAVSITGSADVVVYGCTDDSACNYDPDATDDDGSCAYDGDLCTCPLDGGTVNAGVISDTTTVAYEADWYSFVVDADYDNVSVSLCGSVFDTKLEVWDACDAADYLGSNDDYCGLQSQVDLTDIVAGTYYAKVFGYGTATGAYTLTITAWDNPTAPTLISAVGEPEQVALTWEGIPSARGFGPLAASVFDADRAEEIAQKKGIEKPEDIRPPETRGNTCDTGDDYGNVGAAAVSGTITEAYETFWYSFTADQGYDDVTISLCTGTSMSDTKLEVWYDCADGAFTYYNDDFCGWVSQITTGPMTSGSSWHTKVYGYGTNTGDYTLTITGTPEGTPDPDGTDCATPLAVSGIPYDYTGTTCGLGDSYNLTALGSWDGGEDAIFEFTPAADVNVDLTMDPLGTTWTGFGVFEGCPDVGTLIASSTAYSSSAPLLLSNISLTGGTTYYVMVDVYPSPDCYAFTLNIQEHEDVPAPANDDCADAVSVTGPYPADVSGTTIGATISYPGILDYEDVWYAVELPYGLNHVNMTLCGSPQAIGNTLVLAAASCDDAAEGTFTPYDALDWYTCDVIAYAPNIDWTLSGPGVAYIPIFTGGGAGLDFVATFNVTEIYVPTFNIYRDAAQVATGIAGTTYTDAGLVGEVEYCYTVTQTLEDDTESGNSNQLCATALSGAVVEGCTDPTAVNYDPDANVDDGSCIYWGDFCDYSIAYGNVNDPAVEDSTTEAYDANWHSFVVDADYDFLSVSLCGSDYDTKLEIWVACDDSTYLAYNDDNYSVCGAGNNSHLDLTDIVAGTYYAKVFGWSDRFGDYTLTITAWDTPTTPILTATGDVGAVSLGWESVPSGRQTTSQMGEISEEERAYMEAKYEGIMFRIDDPGSVPPQDRDCWNYNLAWEYLWTGTDIYVSLFPVGPANVSLTSVNLVDYSGAWDYLTFAEAFVSVDLADGNGTTVSNITSGILATDGSYGTLDLSGVADFAHDGSGYIKVSVVALTDVYGDGSAMAPYPLSDGYNVFDPSGFTGVGDGSGGFILGNYNWDIELCADLVLTYVETFNLYKDDALYQSGLTGNSYIDWTVDAGTEYCYTLSQMMEDGTESDQSPEACATPTASTGNGENCFDPIVLSGDFPITASGDAIELFQNDYGAILSIPYSPNGGDMVYAYTADIDDQLIITIAADYDNSIGVFTDCGDPAGSQIAGVDGNYSVPYTETAIVSMVSGTTYYIVNFAWSSAGSGGWTITLEIPPPCDDDAFEDDDTKDQATDHGVDGTFSYALCNDDNPGGDTQPGGFSAIDWSVVTLAPWSRLTATTVGIPEGSSDIDLFIEDYDGDGICQWGGGDDLAGSGETYTEEATSWDNLSDNDAVVYVGVIYFSGDNPVLYDLSLSVEELQNVDAPQNVTAQLNQAQTAILVSWDPPLVDPSARISEAKLTNLGHTKKVLSGKIAKPGFKLSSRTGTLERIKEYNRQAKTRRMESMHQGAMPISQWTLQDYMDNTPASRHNGLMNDPVYNPDSRDTDVTIEVCSDYFYSEGSWNVWDYSNNMYLLGIQEFTQAYECQDTTMALPDGDYSVDLWDSWGDGGQNATVSVGGTVIASGTNNGGSLYVGFTVGAPIPGCMDASACNYNAGATEDDGSCCYDKCITFTLNDQYDDGFEGTITFGDSVMTAGPGGTPASFLFCLTDGDYSYHYSCNNWCSEHTWTVTDDDGVVLSQGSGSNGAEQDLAFSVGAPPPVFGCIDTNACNYDPDATEDDGSCNYPGDSCPADDSCTLYAVTGSNAASGANQFFSYTTTMEGLLTVSSDGTGEDTYLGLLGSCTTNEYGQFTDVFCVNDDIDFGGYNYASECLITVAAGQEVIIFWVNAYSPGPFTFSVTESESGCADDAFEDNDGYTSPAPITEGSYDLQMCQADHDWFSIMVNNGETLRATLTDINETGLMDLLLFALEIDPASALVYQIDLNSMDIEYSNTLDHPTEFLIAARDSDNQAEGPYTLTVELIPFEQIAYSVWRSSNGGEYTELATDIVGQQYMDEDVEPGSGDTHCYTATASLGGATGPQSDPPACVEMELVEPPAAPTNLTAESGCVDVYGTDYPGVLWAWDYDDYPAGHVILDITYDNWPGETSWDLVMGDSTVASGAGAIGDTQFSTELALTGGDYTFTIYDLFGDGICCAYGNGSYTLAFVYGETIVTGGEFGYSESTSFTVPAADNGMAVFNLEDGQYQTQDGARHIQFALTFEFYGTPYEYFTSDLNILIYGFPEGSVVCGTVAAINHGWYSAWAGPECATASCISTVDVTVEHADGWNMVSLPVGVEDASPGALFPGSISGTLYSYPYGDAEAALVLGAGYWLRFDGAGSDVLSGDPVDDVTVSLSEGWNMIGSVSVSANLDDPNGIVIPGTMYDYPYGDPATSVEPGFGYWIRANAAGDVTISSGAGAARLAAESTLEANTIRFNDTQTLYFGTQVNEADLLSYSLPPKPFAGAFDIRFSGDWKIAEEGGNIEVMNNTDKLSIAYDITIPAGEHMRWVLTDNKTEYELSGSGTIEIIGNASDFVLAKAPVVPETYVLSQNYPNPFNPVTNISYGLPKESFVTITVYNIMGQKVAELVNEVRHAGYHTVVWNSANLVGEPVSSGVYVYMITADDYHAVKKMILMK